MLARWRAWRRQRRLGRLHLDPDTWRRVLHLPLLQGLDAGERLQLYRLCAWFLDEKPLHTVDDLRLSDYQAQLIAAQACLPILHLGLDAYQHCPRLVIYPGGFLARQRWTDETGLAHDTERTLVGEAWAGGPVVLSLADVEDSLALDGFNVVIHEFAHQLDLGDGVPNGFPPLPSGMDPASWAADWSTAYADLCRRVDAGGETPLDPYAAEDPGEFFAVVTESFFELPGLLLAEYPSVYRQLSQYFGQDPTRRLNMAYP